MNKNTAKTLLANAAKAQGLKVQVRAGKTADDVRVLNASTGRVVAEGTIKLDNTGYVSADVRKTVNQINVKLGKSKMNASRKRRKMNAGSGSQNSRFRAQLKDAIDRHNYDDLLDVLYNLDPNYEETLMQEVAQQLEEQYGYFSEPSTQLGRGTDDISDVDTEELIATINYEDEMWALADALLKNNFNYAATVKDMLGFILSHVGATNASRRKMNSSRRRKMNAGCHPKRKMNASDDDYAGEDAEFVDDVESIVTDEQGNEIVVDEMLVVQNPETNEISLFVPTDGDDTVPADVEVIGEVSAADDEEVLDSSRRVKR